MITKAHDELSQRLQTFRHWKPLTEWAADLAPAQAGEVCVLMLPLKGEPKAGGMPADYLAAIPECAAVSREQWREFLARARAAKVWRHPLIGQLLEIRASYAIATVIANAIGEPWIKIVSKRGVAESASALEGDILDEFTAHRISTK